MLLSFVFCFDIQYQFASVGFSGSNGRVRRPRNMKHEIHAAAFGGHFFYDLFLQGRGPLLPLPPPPGSANGGWNFQ